MLKVSRGIGEGVQFMSGSVMAPERAVRTMQQAAVLRCVSLVVENLKGRKGVLHDAETH